MKVSITLRPSEEASEKGRSKVCFRVRERNVDIKAVSEITVVAKYWNQDNLAYDRNPYVPKEVQKKTASDIAAIVERAEGSFSYRADSAWLKGIIEDVLHPENGGRPGPGIVERLHEYYEQFEGAKSSRAAILDLERKMSRYHKYRSEIEGERDFRLYVETISLEEMNAFRDYVANECELRRKYPQMYAGCFVRNGVPRPVSDSSVIHAMNILCVFLRWCRKKGYTQSEAFLQYGCRTPVYGDPFFLTIEERNRLYDADLDGYAELAMIRDIFVFQCYIGCRAGDLRRFTRDNVKDGFVEYMPQKTKKCRARTVRVPLHEKAVRIIERYSGGDDCSTAVQGVNAAQGMQGANGLNGAQGADMMQGTDGANGKGAGKHGCKSMRMADMSDKLLPFRSLGRYNAGIKKLLKHCGIDRMVTVLDTHGYITVQKPLYEVATSHTARKTFIGNMYRQVPDPNIIASMSGHAEGSTAFRRYRRIDDEMKRKLVELID